jgi:hypothetical protein
MPSNPEPGPDPGKRHAGSLAEGEETQSEDGRDGRG